MRRIILTGLLVATLSPLDAGAQTYGAFDMGMLTNTLSQDHVARSERKRAQGASGFTGFSQALSSQLGRTSETAPAIDAHYKPTQAVRTRLADIMAEAAGRQGPAEAKEMRQIVLSKTGLNQYVRVAPMLGYRENDAIDALAFYLLAQWGVANDHRPDITRTQAAAVRQQAANAYAQVADQLNTDALRQEFAEMIVIQGAIMAGTHEAAVRSGDDQALERYAALARQGGEKLFTMDPTLIVLTDDGFRRK